MRGPRVLVVYRFISIAHFICFVLPTLSFAIERVDEPWQKHVVFTGARNQTAVAGDFNGDGEMDVVASCGGMTRLFVAPDWKEVVLYRGPRRNWGCIHSETMDVDRDGDLDYIAAVAKQGVFWLENPQDALQNEWRYHVIDNKIHGIHCTLRADIDRDGVDDLLVNNFEAHGAAPNSLTWLEIPKEPRKADHWIRHVLADGDAPGGNHYFGFGDVDGDGDGDVSIGAKGKPFEGGNWFAWWRSPSDPTKTWSKESDLHW